MVGQTGSGPSLRPIAEFNFCITHLLMRRCFAFFPSSSRQALIASIVVILFWMTHFLTCKYFPCLPNAARQALIASTWTFCDQWWIG
jgi:hypothetical protein